MTAGPAPPPRRPRLGMRLLAVPALVALTALGGCGEAPRRPNGRSVVLVVVDTLRADVLEVYGESRPTSPRLLRRAAEAAVFDRALAASPWTLPSFGTILTGRYPQLHGAGVARVAPPDGGRKTFSRLADGVPSLAEIFAAQGYATGAFLTNTFLDPKFGLDRGFGTYDQTFNRFLDDRRADVLVDRALAWIEEQRGKPFFVLLQILDPHLPYDPPAEDQGRFTTGYGGGLSLPFAPRFRQIAALRSGQRRLDTADRAFLEGAYAEQVPFVDLQVARLLDALTARGEGEETLVLVTADHGEELFDHDGFEHGHSLYQEQLHVPLLVWGPEVVPRRIAGAVSLVDVAPTVLEAAGLPQPPQVDGVSLWPVLTGTAAPPRRTLFAQAMLYGPPRQAAIAWPYKLVSTTGDGAWRLFDLEADPGETRDVADVHRRELRELLGDLRGFLRAAEDAAVISGNVEVEGRIEEDLRALGYVD